MQKLDEDAALTFYSEKGPDVGELQKAYDKTVNELFPYFSQCQRSFDERRNYWPGKSEDLRKHGAGAFPWDGASDTEAHVINERINAYVALCLTALARANIRAGAVEAGDVARSKVVSCFLKWMVDSYIPHFKEEMELNANYMFERGLMVTYVGWERENNKYLQKFTLDEIAAASPDLARVILEKSDDNTVAQMLISAYPGLSQKRAKKALNDLRKKGVAEIPVIRRTIDRPCAKAQAPDGDTLFPAYCTDYQQSPYVFHRVKMTVQQILNKVETSGWNREWAEYVIEHFRGVDTFAANGEYIRRSSTLGGATREWEADELVDVIYVYQRLIDREDGSMGIYCTVMHPSFTGKGDVPDKAKFELLNGYEDYPFVVTRLSADNKRLYDLQTVPEMLRGIQWQVKIERDSRIDRNGMATVPTLMHPMGRPPPDWGPGKRIGRMRENDYTFAPTPPFNPGSVEIEQTMLASADKLMGLDIENPLSAARRQYFVDKFLSHVQAVIKMAYNAFQRFGPDELFFRVTGVPDAQRFTKGDPDEDVDISIAFDVQNTDKETWEKKMEQTIALVPLDRSGRINMDALIEFAANMIDPMLADAILQPIEVAQEKMVKDVTDDLTKISSAIEVGARPNGAQMALSLVQQYASQPDVAQRLQQDEAFRERLTKYAEQYQMVLMQQQNAETGKLGTAPAAVGNVGTQTANSQSY